MNFSPHGSPHYSNHAKHFGHYTQPDPRVPKNDTLLACSGCSITTQRISCQSRIPSKFKCAVSHRHRLTQPKASPFPPSFGPCCADPDVILVGEIRDGETAELAIRAALTGHLVLSTLHTVDALSTISRLADLGLSPTLIADALRCVLNQRLVRRLCDTCKTPVTDANRSESEHLFMSLQSDGAALYQPVGCEDCRNTGYAGRIPITQIWEITEDTRLILRNDPHNEPALREEAERRGFQSLFESARELILQGITSVDEAVRVIGNPLWQALGTEYIELKDLEDSETPVKATEKLLLVIEEDSLRARLQQQFEAMNYVVTAVKATSEAKAHIASGYPVDLMLLDVESQFATPMTQFDTLQSALAYIGISAVLLVPEGATEVETLLEIHQATDWLSKPVTDEEVTKGGLRTASPPPITDFPRHNPPGTRVSLPTLLMPILRNDHC